MSSSISPSAMPLCAQPSQIGARISSNDFVPRGSAPFKYAATTSCAWAAGSLPRASELGELSLFLRRERDVDAHGSTLIR